MSTWDNSSVTFRFLFSSFVLRCNFQLSAPSAECQPFDNCCSMSCPLKLPYVSCLAYWLKSTCIGLFPFALPVLLSWQPGDYFGWQVSCWQECPGYIWCGSAEFRKVTEPDSRRNRAGWGDVPGRPASEQIDLGTWSFPSLPAYLDNQGAVTL